MNITVIIPTLNAEKNIAELIMSLKSQSLPPLEIIVIDSASEDRTTEIARGLGCTVITIDRAEFNHGGTRNLGAEASRGEVLVFLTQDALPVDNNLLQNLVAPLAANPEIAASFGRHIARSDAVPPERFARLFNYPDIPMIKGKEDLPRLGIKTFFFSNVCSAIKKSSFEAVDRFPERALTNEDMAIAAKLVLKGYKIAYVPEAAVWHSHNYSVPHYFRRYFDIGAFLSGNERLKGHSKAESEGLKFTKEQLLYLFRNNHYRWIPYSIALTLAKFIGYRLGQMEDKLPVRIKRSLSLQKNFWR